MFVIVKFDHDEALHHAIGPFDTAMQATFKLGAIEPAIRDSYPGSRVELQTETDRTGAGAAIFVFGDGDTVLAEYHVVDLAPKDGTGEFI